MTVNLTTFVELLATMTATQKNNKSGWMDPSDDWGQIGGYVMPNNAANRVKAGGNG